MSSKFVLKLTKKTKLARTLNVINKSNSKLFFGCDNYPKCEYISWDLPIEEKCPMCGFNLFKKFPAKGGTQIICNNKGCTYVKD